MPKEITITLKWSNIIEYIGANKTDVPQESGVYELLVKQRNGEYARRYVGEAEDLRERYEAHLLDDEPNECIKNYLQRYQCGFDYALLGEEDRRDAEQALYDKYKPTCNKIRPAGSRRDVSLNLVEK